MGGSSGSGKTTTENKIPAELSGLTSQTAGRVGEIQNTPGFNPSDYIGSRPQAVPGLSHNQFLAVNRAGGVGDMPTGDQYAYGTLGNAQGYANQNSMPYAGQSGQARGGTLATDPSIAAAYQAYKSNVEPDLQSQFGLMGLGKSSLMGDALAKGAASQLQPAVEGALAREQAANEARIGRQTGAAENQFGRQVSTALNTAGQYAGLGGADTQRRLAELNALMQTGGLERGVGSEQAGADYQERLRQQALAEQATFGTLGQVPSSLGSQVASKTSGGGMFK